jgi:hypothetical protein
MSAESQSTYDPTDSTFTIFYSWQSDLPEATNKRAIRSAIRKAISTVEAEIAGLRIDLDEATRDMPGSPNIPQTIIDKIRNADGFIVDITTINSTTSEEYRKTPNPNVVFELGYAVAHLGWGRIIMVFNEAIGHQRDVPFDFSNQRTSSYRLSLDDHGDKSNSQSLEKMMKEAIRSIVVKQPIKPFVQSPQSTELIQRQRDIANITWVMSAVHLPTIDEAIHSLPYSIGVNVFLFWEEFNARVTSSLFHVYNEVTRTALLGFRDAWGKCLSHGTHYQVISTGKLYIFSVSPSDESTWNEIEIDRDLLVNALLKLNQELRNSYIEIDLSRTSESAWHQYLEDEARYNAKFPDH